MTRYVSWRGNTAQCSAIQRAPRGCNSKPTLNRDERSRKITAIKIGEGREKTVLVWNWCRTKKREDTFGSDSEEDGISEDTI